MTLSFWLTLFSPQGRPLSFKTFLIWVLISIYQGEEEPFIVKEQIPVLDNLNKTHLSLDITEIFQMCWDLRMSSTSGIVNNSNLAWASSEVLETTSASRCSLKLYVAKVVSSQTWKISPVTLQRSKGVLVLLAATSSKSFSLHNTHWQQLWPSPKGINSPGAFLSQERVRNRHLCSLGKNWPSCAGASERLMLDVCDVMWPEPVRCRCAPQEASSCTARCCSSSPSSCTSSPSPSPRWSWRSCWWWLWPFRRGTGSWSWASSSAWPVTSPRSSSCTSS